MEGFGFGGGIEDIGDIGGGVIVGLVDGDVV